MTIKKKCTSCSDSSDNVVAVAESYSPTVAKSCGHTSACGCTQTHQYSHVPSQQTTVPCSPGCNCGKCSYKNQNKSYVSHPAYIPKAPTYSGNISKDAFARIDANFVYPQVGHYANVKITNIVLAEGQVIANNKYGSFIVRTALNWEDGEYELENASSLANDISLIGTQVLCGAEFFLGLSKCNCDDTGIVDCILMLNDFIVPTVGEASFAKVQSLAGFQIGRRAILRNRATPTSAYTYLVTEITAPNTLKLLNEGQGGTVGDTYAADAGNDSQLDWCIEPIEGLGLCEEAVDSQLMAHIIGCDENGVARKIEGTVNNQALVYDSAEGGYTNKVIPAVTECWLLNTPFQIAPLGSVCSRTATFIQTTNDTEFLASVAEVLLSVNAEPVINIGDYEFFVDLGSSVVGAIAVYPTFNPAGILNFALNDPVCIPDDCCAQCAPQIIFPVPGILPPGGNQSISCQIPSSILQSQDTEYKFSLVRYNAVNYLVRHDTATNNILQVYDTSGTPVATPSGLTAAKCIYNEYQYCNENACPEELLFEAGIGFQMTNLPSGALVSHRFNSQLYIYPCNQISVPAAVIQSHQFDIMHDLEGPSKTSAVAVGEDPWGITGAPGFVKEYHAKSGYNSRTMPVHYHECFVGTINAKLLLRIGATLPGSNVFVDLASTISIKTHRL